MSAEPEKPRRLLIVEDEPDISSSLELLLAHPSIRIELAATGTDAVQKARAFRPHAILLDVLLPVMDGFEVFRTLSAEPTFSGTRVIFLSAHAQPGALALAKELGAFDTITKPFRASHLRSRLFAALGVEDDVEPPPVTPPRPLPAARPAHRPGASRTPFVALVDDDSAIAGAIHELLKEAIGASTIFSHHRFGMASLRDFANARPDLILLDFRLPDVDGLSLLRIIRRDDGLRHVPVVLLTASPRSALNCDVSLQAGADAFLFKPIDPGLFVATVRDLYARRVSGGARTASRA